MSYDKDKAVERLIDAGCGAQIAMAIVQGIVEGVEASDHHTTTAQGAFSTAVNATLDKIAAAFHPSTRWCWRSRPARASAPSRC